jgi:uncharacterized protein YkwD
MSRAAFLFCLLLPACVVVPIAVPIGVVTPATPAPAPARPPTAWPTTSDCPVPARAAADARVIVSLVNAERAAVGLSPLAFSAPLSGVAHRHACDNAARQTISHDGSDGSTLAQRLERGGIAVRMGAENTGLGFSSPQIAMERWMKSPGHRANILTPEITLIGVGQADGVPRPTWVLDFIKPR